MAERDNERAEATDDDAKPYGGMDSGNVERDHYPTDGVRAEGTYLDDPHSGDDHADNINMGDAANENPLKDRTNVGQTGRDERARKERMSDAGGGDAEEESMAGGPSSVGMSKGGRGAIDPNQLGGSAGAAGMADTEAMGGDLASTDMDADGPYSIDRSALDTGASGQSGGIPDPTSADGPALTGVDAGAGTDTPGDSAYGGQVGTGGTRNLTGTNADDTDKRR